ncbi:surface protein Rib, partial [Ligilactobacillus salivarius]|uniref:Rib/alpha-like domain-containing protein n=1 Tax=Ligilactobacillus salivarius TaxID=1624 RepID=UPI001DB0650C
SKVTVGDNGDVTVTYPDGSKDTIPGDKVVEGKSDAEKNELKVPSDKVTVGDNGDVTVTYPDGSKDTIPGDKVVEGKSDADKNEL